MAAGSLLVVDDSQTVLTTVSTILGNKYEVLCAINAQKALEVLKNKNVSLILLDIAMPGMDGFALLKRLRQATQTKNTPIVFLSGNAQEENVHRAAEGGADGFIGKPIDARVLREKVAAWMTR